MSDQDPTHRSEPADGVSESVGAPQRDDDPPRRQKTPFVWLAVVIVATLAVAGVVAALGFGLLD